MGLGNEIKKIRIEKHWTQKQLAEKAGIAQGRISMIEAEKYPNMTPEGLKEVLDTLGVTYAEVAALSLTADEKGSKLDEVYDRLNEIYEALFAGNGKIRETRFILPKGKMQVEPYAIDEIDFNPFLAVELTEYVSGFAPGEVLIFVPDSGETIDPKTVYVTRAKSNQPLVIMGADYDPEKDLAIEGRAVRLIQKIYPF